MLNSRDPGKIEISAMNCNALKSPCRAVGRFEIRVASSSGGYTNMYLPKSGREVWFPSLQPLPHSSYGPAQKEFSWHHRLHYCCCKQRVIWQMYLDNISSLEFIQQNRAPAHRMVVVRLNLLLSNGLTMQRGAALDGGLKGRALPPHLMTL